MKPSITILAVDDEDSLRQGVRDILTLEGYEVSMAADGIAALDALRIFQYDLVLLDINMPRLDGMEVLKFIKNNSLDCQVVMLTAINDIQKAVECIKLGAYDYLLKPCSGTEITSKVEKAIERKRLLLQNKALKNELARRAASSLIVTHSPTMIEVLNLAMKVAPTDSTVLIQGESGTGKELVANFIHMNSLRVEQPFVVLNCASIPETLLESELFGHEKGAFTDAGKMKQGLVEIADGGTLFLDELGEISLTIQPKLLRFAETGEYRRVGGTKVLKSDVRILSATNKNLVNEVKNGQFREDLLYRINVFTLELPSLRDRLDDIPFLVENYFKKRFGVKGSWKITDEAIAALKKYSWPGNVRELENVIERATVVAEDQIIEVRDLALQLHHGSSPESPEESGDLAFLAGNPVALKDMEKAHILGVLNSVHWDKKLAAKILAINIKTLYIKIQTYGLTH
jgi:DNA-binding NtrC family response regulator